MDNGIYLLSISLSGIKSIEKLITVNFYKKGIDRKFDPKKYNIKAIYGENGAGKSAIITAVNIFRNIVINEDYLSDVNNQKVLKELINKKNRKFYFECEFLNRVHGDNLVCKYSIEIALSEREKFEISMETLERRNGNYSQSDYKKVYCCKDGILEYVNCDDETRMLVDKVSYNLLSTRSMEAIFLSNHDDFRNHFASGTFATTTLYCAVLALLIRVYLAEDDKHELYFIQKKLNEEYTKKESTSELFEYFHRCMIEYTSVNEKRVNRSDYSNYQNRVKNLTQFIKIFKKELKSIEIDAKEHGDFLECELVMNYGNYKIAREFESTGIKKLISLYDCLDTASNGGIVFIDEMDSNINDVYLCKLIEFFMYYGSGQLCFTTHNIDPMSILKENKNSIEFLSNDNILVPWTAKGNAIPENYYKNGMIANLPFNICATDFIGILGGECDV